MLLFSLYVAFAVAVDRSTASSVTPAAFLGIAPQDGEYFSSEVIYCRDGSKSFSKDLLNDDFCDCSDGTDEPGTSACPEGKFYCRNIGDEPQILFSSRVNDRICDCCDGSDEYDGVVNCQNTCKKNLGSNSKPDSDGEEEVLTSIKDLKIVAIVEFVIRICLFKVCKYPNEDLHQYTAFLAQFFDQFPLTEQVGESRRKRRGV